jgi:hypothetical protein
MGEKSKSAPDESRNERAAQLHKRIMDAFNKEIPKIDLELTKADNSAIDELEKFAKMHGGFVYHSEANGGTDHFKDGTVVSGRGIGIRGGDGNIIWLRQKEMEKLKRVSKK